MRRILGLLEKELSDHGVVVGGVAIAVLGVWLLLLLGTALGPRTITVLEAHAMFMRVFLPLLALALGRRLVVREYHARTQRFLEALPLRRGEVVLVKWVLGATLLSAAALGSLALTAAVAVVREPIDARWIGIVLARTEVFTLCLYGFLFVMGLLGRWRIPIYLALVVLAFSLDATTAFELDRFPPIALVGETFVLERHTAPLADLAVCLAMTAAFGIAAAALALVNEGSVAEAMARTMSRRDKAAVAVALVGAMIAVSVVEERPDVAPFRFEGEVARHGRVDVLYLEEAHRARALVVAEALDADLTALGRVLGASTLPPVHVALHPTLDPHELEAVPLDHDADGVLVRAPFTAPTFDGEALRAFALARVMEQMTDDRAAFEPHAWVRTGLAWHLVAPGAPKQVRRARTLSRHEAPRGAHLARYLQTEERYGAMVAGAAAASAMDALADAAGEARLVAFVRDVIGSTPPPPLLAVIRARTDPVEARLAAHTGLDADALVDAWRARLAQGPAAGIPRAEGWVRIEREGEGQGVGALRVVRWGVRGAVEPGARCALVHAALGPFDRPLAPEDRRREERACEALGPDGAILVGRYEAGERAFLAVEVESPALGGWLRLTASRRTLP